MSITKPAFTVKEVFLSCISTVANDSLKNNLTDCIDVLELAEADFEEKFATNEIYQIPQSDEIKHPIGKRQMVTLYDYRMVHVNMPGRSYYNKIRALAPFGKCPLCGVRRVDTLDHYLPKALFPVFAVTPITLVPACTPCNKGKLVDFPTNSAEQTLHPYFDDISKSNWLQAKVIPSNPITLDYQVVAPDGWDDILIERTINHFISFNLNDLYCSHANEELRGARRQMINRYRESPAELVSFLDEAYDSKLELGLNSWQAVMYKALLNDEWFCSGGVLE